MNRILEKSLEKEADIIAKNHKLSADEKKIIENALKDAYGIGDIFRRPLISSNESK